LGFSYFISGCTRRLGDILVLPSPEVAPVEGRSERLASAGLV
jgi:hypothetical protein